MPKKKHRIDYEKYIRALAEFMDGHGLKLKPYPKYKLSVAKQDPVFGKTAFYDPVTKTVTCFISGRGIKDILRSIAHENVHHHQNLEGRLTGYNGDKVSEDARLTELEGEAYLKGNLLFRSWTEEQKKSEEPGKTFGKHMKKKIDINESVIRSISDRIFNRFWQTLNESFNSGKLARFAKEHGGIDAANIVSDFTDLHRMTDEEFDEYEVIPDPDQFYRDVHRGVYGDNNNDSFQPILFKDGTMIARINRPDKAEWTSPNQSAQNLRKLRGNRYIQNREGDRYRGANPYYDQLVNGSIPGKDLTARGRWGFPGDSNIGKDQLNPRAIRQNHIFNTFPRSVERNDMLDRNTDGKEVQYPDPSQTMANTARKHSARKETLEEAVRRMVREELTPILKK